MTEPRRYVYAIVAADAPLPDNLSGVAEERLALIACGALAAVAGELDDLFRPTVAHVMRHEEIVEATRAMTHALPVRFGTIFPDAASVQRALERRQDVLIADLQRLGDKLEFGLSVLWNEPDGETAGGGEIPPVPEPPQRQSGPGAAYLWERVATERRQDDRRSSALAVAKELDARLSAHALEQRRQLLPTPRLAVRGAYLVGPNKLEDFRGAFNLLRGEHHAYRLFLSGPWPPYSFVTRDSGEGILGILAESDDGRRATHTESRDADGTV